MSLLLHSPLLEEPEQPVHLLRAQQRSPRRHFGPWFAVFDRLAELVTGPGCKDRGQLQRVPRHPLATIAMAHRALAPIDLFSRPRLRPVPSGFSLAPYRDAHGALYLPLARGRISFVRRVGGAGTIELPGGSGRVGRRLAGQYVVATLYPHRRLIVVKLEGRVVKRLPCPIREKLVSPLYPLPRGRC